MATGMTWWNNGTFPCNSTQGPWRGLSPSCFKQTTLQGVIKGAFLYWMYWELSCSLSLGHCCLIKSASVPYLNLSVRAAVNQRAGVWRQGSRGAGSLQILYLPQKALLSLKELLLKCLRRVWSKEQLLKSRLNQETFDFYYRSKIIFVLPLLVVINQKVFQNWYHCFNP